jgi:hypothetical protein
MRQPCRQMPPLFTPAAADACHFFFAYDAIAAISPLAAEPAIFDADDDYASILLFSLLIFFAMPPLFSDAFIGCYADAISFSYFTPLRRHYMILRH